MASTAHFKLPRWYAIGILIASQFKIGSANKKLLKSANMATRNQIVIHVFMKSMWSLVREYLFFLAIPLISYYVFRPQKILFDFELEFYRAKRDNMP